MTVTIEQLTDLTHLDQSAQEWALTGKFPDPTDREAIIQLSQQPAATDAFQMAWASVQETAALFIEPRLTELGLPSGVALDQLSEEQLQKAIQLQKDLSDEYLFQMKGVTEVMTSEDYNFHCKLPEWPEPHNADNVGGPEWCDLIGQVPFKDMRVKHKCFNQGTKSGEEPTDETRWVMFQVCWATVWLLMYHLTEEVIRIAQGELLAKRLANAPETVHRHPRTIDPKWISDDEGGEG